MRAQRRMEALHEPEDTWLDSEEFTYFRFLVPMRDKKGVQALHEPEDTWLDSEELTYFRFLVPMRDKKGVQATHEPRPLTPSLSPAGEEGVRRTGEGDRHWIMVPMRGSQVVGGPFPCNRRSAALFRRTYVFQGYGARAGILDQGGLTATQHPTPR